MFDRFRLLLAHPLDPVVARAILVLASGAFLGLAALAILAAGQPDPSRQPQGPPPGTAPRLRVPRDEAAQARTAKVGRPQQRQDPQDVAGSAAAERAARALRSHRALQHLPYSSGAVSVVLVGARGFRAVLRVSAPTLSAARQAWHRFLRRYRDTGRAYLMIFERSGGGDA